MKYPVEDMFLPIMLEVHEHEHPVIDLSYVFN